MLEKKQYRQNQHGEISPEIGVGGGAKRSRTNKRVRGASGHTRHNSCVIFHPTRRSPPETSEPQRVRPISLVKVAATPAKSHRKISGTNTRETRYRR